MSDGQSRYHRALEIYLKHESGESLVASDLLAEISAAIMPATLQLHISQDRLDRLQFLLDSNPPVASMVVALVDELDREEELAELDLTVEFTQPESAQRPTP
ncbi:MAG: hypothetical protein ACR2PK_07315 [Acidimicrobiales bacterium]